ncbi:hypothetical protein HK098_005240, partial [Nowakowskiella sp. JEL0407]
GATDVNLTMTETNSDLPFILKFKPNTDEPAKIELFKSKYPDFSYKYKIKINEKYSIHILSERISESTIAAMIADEHSIASLVRDTRTGYD